MVGQIVVSGDKEQVKKLAEITFDQEASAEELRAIKMLLVKAGLIVDVKDRHLIILSIIR